MRSWGPVVLFALGAALLVFIVVFSSSRDSASAPSAQTPPVPTAGPPAPPVAWLGLDYNSFAHPGGLSDFAVRGIVYDREGRLEVNAGVTPENSPPFKVGLDKAYSAHMVPDLAMDPASGPSGCQGNPNPSKACLPTNQTDIASFVQGFIQTATAVLHDYPGHRVLFEPLNEPWNWASPPGTTSGQSAAAQYAAILAQLLPAARTNNIPLADIYVPATGMLSDATMWIPDLYRARPCLKPGPASCGPIAGWNLHPYGLPGSSTKGIGSVPRVRAGMLSGRDNLIISEIGFCAIDVNGGKGCDANTQDVVGTSAQAAVWLSKTLKQAARMHRAGWLHALLLWRRSGGGWAMQNSDGSLTAQGRVLDLFADSPAGR